MKKIILLLIVLFCTTLIFSQNYIGKSSFQIIANELYVMSPDSTEMWEKKDVFLETRSLKKESKMIVHDISNFRIISCYFKNDTCISFTVIYYNLSRSYVEQLLVKKYDYNGKESWLCCLEDKRLELCLREEPGRLFIIEACHPTVDISGRQQ